MTGQPTKWMRFRGIEPEKDIMFIHGASSVIFDGPDREANAKLFLRAQHMDELVKALNSSLLVFREADDAMDDEGITPIIGPLIDRLEAILAKIQEEKCPYSKR